MKPVLFVHVNYETVYDTEGEQYEEIIWEPIAYGFKVGSDFYLRWLSSEYNEVCTDCGFEFNPALIENEPHPESLPENTIIVDNREYYRLIRNKKWLLESSEYAGSGVYFFGGLPDEDDLTLVLEEIKDEWGWHLNS